MTFREYFEHLDASIIASLNVLAHTSKEFLLVLIIVPIQILYLVFAENFLKVNVLPVTPGEIQQDFNLS